MKKYILPLLILVVMASTVFSQKDKDAVNKPAVVDKAAAAAADAAAMDTAKAVLVAHGGDKLKKMTSLVMKGSADLTFMGQAIPGAFSTAVSGDKYFFEINTAMQPLKQIYDGSQTYTSMPGVFLPPVSSIGFAVLQKIGDKGYIIAGLDETKKKRKGFRITTPDGFYTDFFVDEKTSQIKGYESSFDAGGRVVSTSVEFDEFQTVDGVVVPKRYSQRFDLSQMTGYANFKTKVILVNSTIEDSAFAIPK